MDSTNTENKAGIMRLVALVLLLPLVGAACYGVLLACWNPAFLTAQDFLFVEREGSPYETVYVDYPAALAHVPFEHGAPFFLLSLFVVALWLFTSKPAGARLHRLLGHDAVWRRTRLILVGTSVFMGAYAAGCTGLFRRYEVEPLLGEARQAYAARAGVLLKRAAGDVGKAGNEPWRDVARWSLDPSGNLRSDVLIGRSRSEQALGSLRPKSTDLLSFLRTLPFVLAFGAPIWMLWQALNGWFEKVGRDEGALEAHPGVTR